MMGFRSDAELSAVCKVICGQVGLGSLWQDEGPTPSAVAMLESNGGALSSGERVMVLTAFALWNSDQSISFADIAYGLDAKRLTVLATLLQAMAQGRVDAWLAKMGS